MLHAPLASQPAPSSKPVTGRQQPCTHRHDDSCQACGILPAAVSCMCLCRAWQPGCSCWTRPLRCSLRPAASLSRAANSPPPLAAPCSWPLPAIQRCLVLCLLLCMSSGSLQLPCACAHWLACQQIHIPLRQLCAGLVALAATPKCGLCKQPLHMLQPACSPLTLVTTDGNRTACCLQVT